MSLRYTAHNTGMRGGYITSELASFRNRCRVAQMSLEDTPYLAQFGVRIYFLFFPVI